MLPIRSLAFALALAVPALAVAQWQWIDRNGQRVFSDQPPPADIPPKNILRQPGMRAPSKAAEPSAAASAPATAAASAPRITGKDPALEARRKQAEAQAAAKKKQQEEQAAAVAAAQARARADNCARARQAKANFDSGIRISRVNDKGEREVLDDRQRAEEVKKLEAVIARDCAPAQ